MTQVRTVSTRTDSTGRSLLFRDEEIKVGKWPGADAGDAIIWSTSKVPVDNSDEDLKVDKRKVGNTIQQGSVFRLTELGPGFRSPMHRTLSTDYCVVLTGELDLCLDSGKIVRLLAGDTLVQRGTNHAWFNPGPSQRCRFAACMIEASPVLIAGRTLPPTPVWQMIVSSLRNMMFPRKATPGVRKEIPSLNGGVRRVVTGHDQQGRAIIESEEDIPLFQYPGVACSEVSLWRTSSVRPDNSDDDAVPTGLPNLASPDGTLFEMIELGPNESLTTGHSDFLEYCLVLFGELQVELDGSVIVLRAEDALVQRGTRQLWRNPSNAADCRVYRCAIAGEPKDLRDPTSP